MSATTTNMVKWEPNLTGSSCRPTSEPPRRPQCHDPIAPDSPATTTLVQVSELNLMEMFTLKMNSFGLIISSWTFAFERNTLGPVNVATWSRPNKEASRRGLIGYRSGAFLRSTRQSHGV
jgi:hypothetical protein